MSSNHSNNHHHRSHNNNKPSEASLFETYRQIAPETLDDESLRNIIKANLNKHDAIIGAIENIWHDTPDQKAVGQDWVTTGIPKPKKQEPFKTTGGRKDKNSSGNNNNKGATTGNDNKGERGGPSRTQSLAKKDQLQVSTPSPVVSAISKQTTEKVLQSIQETNAGNVAATFEVPKAAIIWGQGASLAEKLKKAEKENLQTKDKNMNNNITLAPVSATEAQSAESISNENRKATGTTKKNNRRSRNNKRGQDETASEIDLPHAVADINLNSAVDENNPGEAIIDITARADNLSNEVDRSVLVNSSSQSGEISNGNDNDNNNAHGSFLKMGKWESSVDTADSFKFGSFGSFNDTEAMNPVSSAVWHETEKNNTSSSQSVWNNSSSLDGNVSSSTSKPAVTVSPMGSLFTSSNSTSSSNANTAAPPGLVQNNQIASNKSNTNAGSNSSKQAPGQNKNKVEIGQASQQLPVQSVLYQPYNQQMLPPGIPPGITNRNIGINSVQNIPPYSYAGSPFDLSQAQYPPYIPAGIAVPPPALSTATPVTNGQTQQSSSSTSTTTTTTINSNAQQPTPVQQQYPTAPFPYYANPYYTNQAAAAYYYGQPQLSNYYNQGRGMYQQQRGPYGADLYGNTAGMYPGDLYQQQGGQFSESANNGSSNQVVSANKSTKGTNSTTTSQQQQVQGISQDHNLNSNYGGYVNPYSGRGNIDAQAWQYSQNQAAGWAPIMGFPTAGTPTTVAQQGGGFPQQSGVMGGIASQQQNNSNATQHHQGQGSQQHNNNRTANNGYPNAGFGARVGNNSIPSTSNGTANTQVNW